MTIESSHSLLEIYSPSLVLDLFFTMSLMTGFRSDARTKTCSIKFARFSREFRG
eukprot:UN18518